MVDVDVDVLKSRVDALEKSLSYLHGLFYAHVHAPDGSVAHRYNPSVEKADEE